MISDKLVIAIGILEVLLFGGVVYGFSFLQTVLEKEFTYWEYFWFLGCKVFSFSSEILLYDLMLKCKYDGNFRVF